MLTVISNIYSTKPAHKQIIILIFFFLMLQGLCILGGCNLFLFNFVLFAYIFLFVLFFLSVQIKQNIKRFITFTHFSQPTKLHILIFVVVYVTYIKISNIYFSFDVYNKRINVHRSLFNIVISHTRASTS